MNPVRYVDTGVIYCDDNLDRLRDFPDECVDLIYLDPPFFSNKHYEVIWGDEAEVRSFGDRWKGGINHYLNWMEERVAEMHRVLRSTGSLYLHCDWHAGHYLKVMLDGIFGSKRFQNEIAWYYRGGGVSRTRWGRRHDTIFFYAKDKGWVFNVDPVRTEYSESVTSSHPSRYDKSYRGSRVYSGYRPNPLGKHPDDVWPIQPIMPSDKTERLGYPTQKPEALLERIILASSNPGQVVLDPFCGCGTALAVSERLGREWVGIDISSTAVGIMERRILKQTNGAVHPRVEGMPVTEEDLRALKPFEFQNWVIQRLNGTHSIRKTHDMGIDGWSFMERLPIQVKQYKVGREDVDKFETATTRAKKHKGYMVGFGATSGAVEEAARAKRESGLDIEFVDVMDLAKPAGRPPTPTIEQLFPTLPESILDLPLPKPRPKKARPTVAELVKSRDKGPVAG